VLRIKYHPTYRYIIRLRIQRSYTTDSTENAVIGSKTDFHLHLDVDNLPKCLAGSSAITGS
jgi:hypothetical protein